MRFLTLIAGTMLFALIAFSTIRFWGQGQTYKEFQTPYFAKSNSQEKQITPPQAGPEIIVPWEQAQLLKQSESLILWVNVYRTQDQNILAQPWMDRNKAHNLLEQSANPTRPLLKDLLLQNPQNRFVINCNANVDGIHRQLVQVIQEAKAVDRVLLQSDYNTILTSAKELEPMMIYGSSLADLTRIKTLNALWLLPAASFKGDVLFVNLKYRGRDNIDSDIVLEMKRRFKKIFIGPLAAQKEVQQALALGADGLFVQDPSLIPK